MSAKPSPSPAMNSPRGAGPRTTQGPKGTVVRKRKQVNREAQSAARSAAGGNTAGMMRNFNDEAPGLKVDPVMVLVASLVFIASVFLLHIYGKLTGTK
ncbi:Sec61beta family-domain-containing protein [Catenaria anguillulae PL171]|uniref:Protein transport protein Sec61 subunit beta n=1 Tax=Catenaria anguillulae PL171 TaxID=765915 RepID=A0A1Y2HU14_9FUNG|nr:Sec61beta family-domain-containing protein [Catenaria anguillulae PL171]